MADVNEIEDFFNSVASDAEGSNDDGMAELLGDSTDTYIDTNAPVTEVVVEEAPVGAIEPAPVPTELPTIETTEVVEEVAKTELDLLKEQNALLLARLNEVQTQINTGVIPVPAAVPDPAIPGAAPTTPPVDIFGGQDFDEVLSSKEKFLAMLLENNKMVLKHAYENLATTLPNVVTEQVNYNQKMRDISNEFYSANSDLANAKPTVQAVMTSIMGANPAKPLSEVLAETATKTRELLGLNKTITKPPATAIAPPGPGTGSKRMDGGTPKATSVSDELEGLARLGF